jgi:hypothetical protein
MSLREEPQMQAQLPQGITRFKDDDDGFLTWLTRNPDGYVMGHRYHPRQTEALPKLLRLTSETEFDGASSQRRSA